MKKNHYLTIICLIISSILFNNRSNAQKWTYYKDNTDVLSTSLSKDGTIWLGTTDGIIHITSSGSIIKKYTKTDGLPNDNINYVFSDKDNNLWAISTNSGVYKFDGKNWTFFINVVDGIKVTNLNSLCQDKNNNLWFAGDGQIVKFDGKKWYSLKSNDIGTDIGFYFKCCFQDKNGNIWFGSYAGGGAVKYDGTTWKQYLTSNSGIGLDFINQITEDSNGNIWFATSFGVSKFDSKNWTRYYSNDIQSGLVNDFMWSIFVDKKGVIWSGTVYGEFYKFDGNRWNVVDLSTTKVKANNRRIYSILQDNEGAIWINGTSKFDGAVWKDLDFGPDEFSNHDYRSSANSIGPNGTYWFGTGSGVSIYDNNKWLPNVNFFEKNKEPTISAILKDKNDNIWVTNSRDGIIKISPNNQKTVYNSVTSGIPSNYVFSIYEDKNGKIWITTSKGISVFNGSSWSNLDLKSLGLSQDNVNDKVIEFKGTIILGAFDGTLISYDGTKASVLDIGIGKSTLTQRNFSKFFVDNNDNLWVCNFYGVWKYDGKNTTEFNDIGFVNDIKQDKQGNLWFACNANNSPKNGIYKFDGKNFTWYNPSNSGLPNYDNRSIFIDEKEQLWFGSNQFMSVFCPSESPKFDNISSPQPVLEKQNINFKIVASNVQIYQWQVSTIKNPTWQNIPLSNNDYEGQLTNSMSLISAQIAQNGNKYRCFLVNRCNDIISNVITLSVSAILGLQNEEEKEVVIYPNPANDYVKINAPKGRFIVSLIDNNGNVLKQVESQNQISTKELPNGTYYLKIESSDNVTNHKFVILK